MALPVKTRPMTPEEYLRIEREALDKSKYDGGEMFAIAGGKPRHSLIGSKVLIAFGKRLEGRRCTPYNSDLRIGIPGEDLYTYPDVSVFCEPMTFIPGTDDTATNPTLIVEVLSKTTEAYDRGKKFESYRKLASLREYLLVSQDAPLVECFTREDGDRWVLTTARGLDASLRIPALDLDLPLAEVFDKVDFSPARPAAAS